MLHPVPDPISAGAGGRGAASGAHGGVSTRPPSPIAGPAHLRSKGSRPPGAPTPNTALWVILGLSGGLALLSCVGFLAFINTEIGGKSWEILQKGGKLMWEASNAPGAEEVRALGCETAMVLPISELRMVAGPEADGVDMREDSDDDGRVVLCQVGPLTDPPECGEVARTYASALPAPPPEILVLVMLSMSNTRYCEGVYDRSGNPLRPLGKPAPAPG